MTSSRPYLIRALYEWIVDNEMTPYIVVDAAAEGLMVPAQYVQDGQIVLNINPRAVEKLQLSNTHIAFSARFGGAALNISVPPRAVLAIYARENGEGMMFRDGGDDNAGNPPPPESPSDPTPRKPRLRVVRCRRAIRADAPLRRPNGRAREPIIVCNDRMTRCMPCVRAGASFSPSAAAITFQD